MCSNASSFCWIHCGGRQVIPWSGKNRGHITHGVTTNQERNQTCSWCILFLSQPCKKFRSDCKTINRSYKQKTPAHPQITEVEVRAFEELIRCVCEAPVLAAPRFGSPYRLYTDASQFSVGCCLAQADEPNVEHAIAYGSQKLTPTSVLGVRYRHA